MTAVAVGFAIATLSLAGAAGDGTAALAIQSAVSCPSASAVYEALGRFTRSTVPADVSIAIGDDQDALTIVFARVGQGGPESRRIALSADCAARAEAVAIVVASWLGELPVQALPEPTLRLSVPAAPPSAPQLAGDSVTELGVGALGSASAGWAPGLRLELVRAPRARSGFGFGVSVTGTGARDVALGAGVSRWTRVALAAAPRFRAVFGSVLLDAEVGPAAALTIAWGRGYDVDRLDLAFTWGGVAGLRVGRGWGALRLWADARGFAWLAPQRVSNDLPANATQSHALPAADVHFTLGASYVFL